MKRLLGIIASLLLVSLLSVNAKAQTDTANLKVGKLEISGVTAADLQDLQQSNSSGTLPKLEWGIQNAEGNVWFDDNITSGIHMHFGIYLSSAHHEGFVTPEEGYVLISKLPQDINIFDINQFLKYVHIKAGAFKLDFGNYREQSDNADVQRNPLVGNYIIAPFNVEPGVELRGHFGDIFAVAGISTGVPTAGFQTGRGTAFHGKIRVNFPSPVDVSFSYYGVNNAGNPSYANGGSFSSMFAGNRSGSKYAAVILGGADAGQILPAAGQDVYGWEVDASYNLYPLRVSGLYGYTKDSDINGSAPGTPSENWAWYGAEVKYSFSRIFYAAARYDVASTSMFNGKASDGYVGRSQVGIGLWLAKGMLLKVGYVYQQYENFNQVYLGNPEFNGLVSEMSVAF